MFQKFICSSLLILVCFNWTPCDSMGFGMLRNSSVIAHETSQARMLQFLEPLKKYGAEASDAVKAQWNQYKVFQTNLEKIMHEAQRNPEQALNEFRLNGTIKGICYVPQICGNLHYQTKLENRENVIKNRQGLGSDESDEESNENPIQREPRQDITPANIFPFLGLIGFLAIIPFLIANLVMAFVTFGLSVSSLSDGTRLTDLHQAQLKALAGFAGIPAAIVDPAADGAPLTRTDLSEESNEAQNRNTMRRGRPYLNHKGIIENTRQDLNQFLHQFNSMSVTSKLISVLAIGGTWIGISLGMSVFGPAALILSFVFIAIPLLTLTGTVLRMFNKEPVQKSQFIERSGLNSKISFSSKHIAKALASYSYDSER